ncbi:MAG: hypothetical protein ACYTFY_04100 [Planctomycetota bacterium]|jgi:hypothetical protein
MCDKCNKHIIEALELSERLINLSEDGDRYAQDDNCVILYGIIRDCAYKIKRAAEAESKRHLLNNQFNVNSDIKSV